MRWSGYVAHYGDDTKLIKMVVKCQKRPSEKPGYRWKNSKNIRILYQYELDSNGSVKDLMKAFVTRSPGFLCNWKCLGQLSGCWF
jgi:hypothetical protein